MLVTQKLLETIITDHSSKTIQPEFIDMFVPNLEVIYTVSKTLPPTQRSRAKVYAIVTASHL